VTGPTPLAPVVPVRLIARSGIERLLDMRACIDEVESAFRMRALGHPIPSGILGLHAERGGIHVKAALLPGSKSSTGYFATKINANFPANPVANGLPTIQGLLVLNDATTGAPLAVMDSAAVTILRTAAATAVAARHLARSDASVAAIIGCGAQAMAQLSALRMVRPISSAVAYDTTRELARAFAQRATEQLGISVTAASELREATLKSEIIVTCTTARRAFLGVDDVREGAFVAAVGADSEHKSEIEVPLLRAAGVVTDSTAQCSTIGDLHHAIEAGVMTASDVRAELGEVIVDSSKGRRNASEVVVFDSTGVAFQDVVSAALIYETAVLRNVGTTISFTA
jgi:alanine dehydrogenase